MEESLDLGGDLSRLQSSLFLPVMHQLLEHRWKLSEREGRDVSLEDALPSFIEEELSTLRDEATLMINPPTDVVRQMELNNSLSPEDLEYDEDASVWAADPD